MIRVSRDNFVIKKRYSSLYLPIEIGVIKYSVIILEAYLLVNNKSRATGVL